MDPEIRKHLVSYAPELVAARLARDPDQFDVPSAERTEGALLFVDISGFTPLTERLAQKGPSGAEELGRILNGFFAETVDEIAAHGGIIVDFAGDALFAVWLEEDLAESARRATQCAIALQEIIQTRGRNDISLAIKTTVGAGAIQILHVALGPDHRSCVVGGEAQRQVAAAEKFAEPTNVILSESAANLLGTSARTRPLFPGCVRLVGLNDLIPPRSRPTVVLSEDTDDALSAYLPRSIQERVGLGQEKWLAEFRRVTSVFVNVIGLELDAEDAAQRLQKAARAIHIQAQRFSGQVQQFVIDDKGTVMLVAFGLPPRSHEDDARRGIRAALAMEEAIAGLGLRSAIGITTGWIFCGPVGSDRRREFQVQGDAVNLAARLMQAALDDVLCDAATARQAPEQCEALSPIEVKGKAAPIPIFRPTGDDTGFLGPSGDTTPLVGRSEERQRLLSRIHGLRDDKAGGVVILEGEAGIGKSRLLKELVLIAQESDVGVLYGAGNAIDGGAPYHGWKRVFEEVLDLGAVPANPGARRRHTMRRLRKREARLELAPLLNPVLHLEHPESAATASLSAAIRSALTCDLLVELLKEEVSTQPIPSVLILEDAHWLDTASWTLLHRVAQEIPHLLIVMATRPPTGKEVEDLDALKAAAADFERLSLSPMTRRETADLVCHLLGVEALPPEVGDLIRKSAEGNPFFSEEIALSLRQSGILLVDARTARLSPMAELEALRLPDTIQGVVVSRLDALNADEQFLIKVASVLGRTFQPDMVQAIHPVDLSHDDLLRHLKNLEAQGLIRTERSAAGMRYAFKHPITREVAYESMLHAQRQKLHRRAAEAIEQVHGDADPAWVTALAHHWKKAAEAGENDTHAARRAVKYLEMAGARALKNGAFVSGHAFLEDALRLLRKTRGGGDSHRRELRLLMLLGTSTFTTEGYGSPKTAAAYHRAWEVAAIWGTLEEKFQVKWGQWIALHFANATDEALAKGEEMLALAKEADDPELIMQAHHGLWTTLISRPDYERAEAHLKAGLALYQPSMLERHCVQFGGHDPGACGERAMGLSSWTRGFPDKARAHAHRAMELGQRHAYTLATTQLAAAFVARQRGDVDEAVAIADALIAQSKENALPGFIPWAQVYRAWARGMWGDAAGGIEAFEALIPDLGYLDPGYMCMLLDLYLSAGNAREGLELLRDLFALVEKKNERNYEPELFRYRGHFHQINAGDGSLDDDEREFFAEEDFRRALRLARDQGARSFELRAAMALVGLFPPGSRKEKARDQLREIYNQFAEGFETRDLKAAQTLLGESLS
jgi:class 3 adenylate cyclase/tetratricopeptide (TPR) repeat protein